MNWDRRPPPEGAASGDWQRPLRSAGAAWQAAFEPLLSAADPERRVTPRSRHLCAALGLLAQSTCEALGGAGGEEAGRAAAGLSLLTKVDDEVIDRRSFHGGVATDRRALRARTAAFLAPTLESLRRGAPASAEPRCALAADVGRRLRALSAGGATASRAGRSERLDHLIEVIADGWATQVDAVAVLSSHPGGVTLEEVMDVTARISGAWLLMITLVGTLPPDVARRLTDDEERAFFGWGYHIQRADALADLAKDAHDGLMSSFAGRLAWERAPEAYLDACARGDVRALYALVARHRIDEASLAGGGDPRALSARLAALGGVPSLLGWIHGFLMARYLAHPACQRDRDAPAFRRFHARRATWTGFLAARAARPAAAAAAGGG